MWNDIETTEDLLNFKVVADTAAQIIRDSGNQPISIGVSGAWGAGKSSLAKMIALSLKSDSEHSKYIFIDFDAWLYQGYDDAKISLLQIVSDRLSTEAKGNEKAIEKAKDFAKRINWLKVGKLLAPVVGGAITGGALGGPVGGVIGAVGGIIKSGATPTPEALESLKDAYTNLGPELPGLLKDQTAMSIPKEISELRNGFSELLEELGIKLVVTIDDLDRCLPDTAISTLEAVRLLLFLPNTAFIIAADEQMIKNAVKVHFGDVEMSSELVTSYFDKLIQIPIHVPRLGTTEIKAYLILLLAQERIRLGDFDEKNYLSAKKTILTAIKQSWKQELTLGMIEEAFGTAAATLQAEIEIADQLAWILVNSDRIMGNPRLIKRFLNDLMIKRTIATAQGLSISFDEHIKLQLFERCASVKAFEVLLQKISDTDGKVEFLKTLEEAVIEGKEDLVFPDQSWNDEFIRGWLELRPKLGETDLRPLIYLSRDRSIAMQSSDELSPEGQQILAIMNAGSKFDPSLVVRIKSIGEAEANRLFIRIKKSIRSQQWEHKTVIQSLHLLQAFPSLGNAFVTFLNEMPPNKRQPALVPQLQKEAWGLSVLQQWVADDSTPDRTVKAIEVLGGV